MSKVLDEIRSISSQKLAEQQKSSENKYPSLIQRVKAAAEMGKTECEFSEHEIDQFSKKLLEVDGFTVYATTKVPKYNNYNIYKQESQSVWIVRW